MCDVGARCPTCHRDLAEYETECRPSRVTWGIRWGGAGRTHVMTSEAEARTEATRSHTTALLFVMLDHQPRKHGWRMLGTPAADRMLAWDAAEPKTHRFECPCGVEVTVTEPVPGLTLTRQNATYQP